jgi:atlastin
MEESVSMQQGGSEKDFDHLVGRPLEIVAVSNDKSDEKPIQLNEIGLQELRASLKAAEAKHGQLPLVVQSAAGAFREGKSFILDCFLRYLYHLENSTDDDLILENEVESDFLQNCNLLGPLPDGSEMFESRSSTDRVTSGIWFYSRPFVITNLNGQKVAVLLMDTQGLFDVGAASKLDAPIFALSVLLSSKQIINKRGQFNASDWQLLNMFTEFANEIVRRLHRGKDPKVLGEKAFQELEFLARDFQNFEMDIEDVGTTDCNGLKVTMDSFLAHCTESSNEYLDGMTKQMATHHKPISDRIQNLYTTISCTCLCHPGDKMISRRWNGDGNLLTPTFRALVARYCRNNFANPIIKQDILGNQMSFDSFITWVREFTKCMMDTMESGQLPNVDDMVKVVTQHQLKILQEEAIDLMKKRYRTASKNGREHIVETEFQNVMLDERMTRLAEFTKAAQFGPEEEIEGAIKELENKLLELEKTFKDSNQLAMANILVFFAPYATFAVALYLLDWISDWVCDSYLSACQTASSFMAFYYTIVFFSIVGYSGMKYKVYGPHGIWAATAPLATEISNNFQNVINKFKAYTGQNDDASSPSGTSPFPSPASPSSDMESKAEAKKAN